MNDKKNALLKFFPAIVGFIFLATTGCHQKEEAQESLDPKLAKLKVPEGFHVERLYNPSDNNEGSWVAMTFDDKGRIIACDQYGYLYRITVPPIGADTTVNKMKVDKLEINVPGDTSHAEIKMGMAHGLLWAFNSLYVTVNDEGEGADKTRPSGLYRLQDTNGDDQFDKITVMKRLYGQGEHGPHSIVLSPDKKSLYVVAGNFTDLPGMDNYYLPNTWKNDNLLPLLLDPNGFGNNRQPPGGWIAKTDSTGSRWELFSSGFRNPFDIAFNEDGELFTYDSDMEWDMGLPWYRPTRICHVTSGADFGYRENNGKWQPAYPDNVPAILNIGPGSPTNVMSGMNTRFPEKYRRGLFAFDWSYGIIYHIALQPEGATYKAKAEEFISGSPLPLTDGAIGPDGAMYFLTGGRRINSDVYRVYYGNNDLKTTALTTDDTSDAAKAREIRRKLEAYQEKTDASTLDVAWPYLGNSDRAIRYAARIAIEHLPVQQWQAKALAEKDPVALTQATIALARNGNKNVETQMLDALMAIDYARLNSDQQTDLLRAFELTLSRMGLPAAAYKERLIAYLDPKYPATGNILNQQLCKVLAYIGDPQIIPKTMDLIEHAVDEDTSAASSNLILRNPRYGMDVANMLANRPPAQKIFLATVLSKVKDGWAPEQREKYFKLFYTFFEKKGGNSYIGYIDEARKNALGNAPSSELAHFKTISGDSLLANNGRSVVPPGGGPKGPGRKWATDEALQVLQSDSTSPRDFSRGKVLFSAILCASCHSMAGSGGSIGPDLTQLGTRFSTKDILEAMIDPDKEISDQYAATNFILKDGSTILGRLVRQDDNNYYVSQNPFAPQQIREVAKKDVLRIQKSDQSIML
ncbi:heme-binding protein, partial [Parafilimonas sp.]|uniref:heme-binding protein n=1 Tax=Parafilimonas sp. TaxID=1969739 RepID=UPI0039E42201